MRSVLLPGSLDELWDILAQEPKCAVYAGGTDLLVGIRSGIIDPPSLVCIERIEELTGVRDEGETVFIGAAATHSRLLSDPVVSGHFPVLTKALEVLAAPPIRNMGTIGGNIVNASPAGDTLPPLYVLKAEVEIQSRHGSRRMALAEFITGPGQVRLDDGEILSGVWVKRYPEFNITHYEKVGRRKGQACAIASLAALLRTNAAGMIEEIRLAWGSVGPTVVTSTEAEEGLVGKRLCQDSLREVVPLVEQTISPIDDIRASAEYRRAVAGNLLLRLAEFASRP